MSKIIKNVFIVIIIIVFIVAFYSYTSLSVNNLSVVIAIGIDTADTNNLRVSFQFINTSSVSDSDNTKQSPSTIYTIIASSITSAINLINNYTGKDLNLSHCKLIAISEEFASNGISKEIYSLINNEQIRPNTNIVITKCTAKYYLEKLSSRYYELFSNSKDFTGYTVSVPISDFFNNMTGSSHAAYATLGGVTNETPNNNDTKYNSQKDSSSISNESPLTGITSSENLGLAIFKNDKLIGELNSIETLSFLGTNNNLKEFLISVPDPEENDSYIDVHFIPSKNTSVNVNIINGTPHIKIKYHFVGRIYSMNKNSKYLDGAILKKIEKSSNSYLESYFSNYLYKTSKDLKADINNFGLNAKSNFLTINDFNNYNWDNKYKDSFFDITVDTKVLSGFLLKET